MPVHDCNLGMLSALAAAAAATAQFARSADPLKAQEALQDAWFATDEGALRSAGPHEFVRWFVDVALPAAYQERRLRRAAFLS